MTVAVLMVSWPMAGHAEDHSAIPPELQQMDAFLGIMLHFYEVVDSTHSMAANPEKAAILEMHKIQEVYDDRGEKFRSIEVFRNVIKRTSNPTIRSAAYIMLGDVLKDTGRSDEAIEALNAALDESLKQAR